MVVGPWFLGLKELNKNIRTPPDNFYDITSALREGVLYPSLDPSIFEIKFPNSDIKGKVLGDNLGVTE